MNKTICEKCWNKGYSTELKGDTVLHADFIGDVEKRIAGKVEVKLCDCDRGKDLNKYFKIKE